MSLAPLRDVLNCMKIQRTTIRTGLSLLELLAVVVIIGFIAAIVVPRISVSRSEAADKTCKHNRALINEAIERYALDTGAYPTGLGDLAVPTYFPDDIPVCPVSGQAYTINGQHRIDGHTGGVHP